ncbi:hypothetical protein QTN25_008340 [Entamoeba marina]
MDSIVIIHKVFPYLNTLQINIQNYLQYKNIIQTLYNDVTFIRIVYTSELPFIWNISNLFNDKSYTEFDSTDSKLSIAFQINQLTDKTATINLFDYTTITLQNILNFKNIKHLYLKRVNPPSLNEVNLLNNCSFHMKVIIILSIEQINEFKNYINLLYDNVFVAYIEYGILIILPHSSDIDTYLFPFNNTNNTTIFNLNYQPFKLTISENMNNVNDYSLLTTLQKITIDGWPSVFPTKFKLPSSIQFINITSTVNRFGSIEITNWDMLTNIKEINDRDILFIPYPHIKSKKYTLDLFNQESRNLYLFITNMITVIYLLISFIFNGYNIITFKYSLQNIHTASFIHIFGYIHLTLLSVCGDNYYRFHYQKLNSSLIYYICFVFLLYPYILLFYQSTIFIHYLVILTIPLLCVHISCMIYFSPISHHHLNQFFTIIFHGYWINVLFENSVMEILNNELLLWEFSIVWLTFSIPIGLIISLFFIHGILFKLVLFSLFGLVVSSLLLLFM